VTTEVREVVEDTPRHAIAVQDYGKGGDIPSVAMGYVGGGNVRIRESRLPHPTTGRSAKGEGAEEQGERKQPYSDRI